MICATDGCETTLGSRNKSGLCRSCVTRRTNQDPTMGAKRAAGLRRAMEADPELRKRMAERGRANWLNPEIRAKAIAGVKKHRNWEKGQAVQNSETHAKIGRAVSETRLKHIPREYRDLYRYLMRTKRYLAADCVRLVNEQIEADKRQWHREWGVAA